MFINRLHTVAHLAMRMDDPVDLFRRQIIDRGQVVVVGMVGHGGSNV